MNRLREWLRQWWNRRIPPASRVQLNQRQVFIVPTRTGFAFGCALLLMLLVAINYQNSLAYALAFLLGSLGLLTALHTWRNLAGLELQGLQAEPCFAGEEAVFALALTAKGPRYGIDLGWRAPLHTRTDVVRNQQARVLLSLPATRRGWLQAPRLRVETRFPLGIWVAWSQVDLAMRTLVYPQPLDAGLPLAAARNEDDAQGLQAVARGTDDYQGLEAWQRGDSLRRVDWKAWSRGQGLWVKQFSDLLGSETLLDYSQLQGDTEQRLSVLCFHVLRLDNALQPYTLQLPGQAVLGPDSGPAHRDSCLSALALFGREAP
ncbi:MAG: DUF58 domain-containing protein [Gammaproteobacteria bacterium]|nr:DUF58 domain-containing protein [Gammaproteobacteria bacterium]